MESSCRICRREIRERMLFRRGNKPLTCSNCGTVGCESCFLQSAGNKSGPLEMKVRRLEEHADHHTLIKRSLDLESMGTDTMTCRFCGPKCAADMVFFNDYHSLKFGKASRPQTMMDRIRDLERARDRRFVELSEMLYENLREPDLQGLLGIKDENLGEIHRVMRIGYNFLVGDVGIELRRGGEIAQRLKEMDREFYGVELFFFLHESFYYWSRVKHLQEMKGRPWERLENILRVLMERKHSRNIAKDYRLWELARYYDTEEDDPFYDRNVQKFAYDAWVCYYLLERRSLDLDSARETMVRLLKEEYDLMRMGTIT